MGSGKKRFLAILGVLLLISSVLAGIAAPFLSSENEGTQIALVETTSPVEINVLNQMGIEIIERYDDYSFVEADMSEISHLEEMGISVYVLKDHTNLSSDVSSFRDLSSAAHIKIANRMLRKGEGDFTDIPTFPGYDSMIHSMMNKTNGSQIYDYIDKLQNFKNENGTRTRRDGTLGFEKAVNWTYQKLESFGLNAFRQNFTYDSDSESSNVIAELPGSNPDLEPQTFIICGHLDSTNSRGADEPAPGADDNGSGIALTLEAARVMSQYQFNRTVRFAAWGAEEEGLHGSSYYASNIDTSEQDLRGVLNYDMIGYENGTQSITLHADQQSNWILDYKKDVTEAYNVGLNFTYEYNSSETRSDHSSFWDEGYNATLAIESEFSPYYHSENDTLDKITIPQITKLTSQAVGTAAHLAEPTAKLEGPSIVLESPTGGEKWEPGSERDIRWDSKSGEGTITGVDLEYSTDGGDTWNLINESVEDTGFYTWKVPEDYSTECLIRATVKDSNGMSDADVSDDPFEIVKMIDIPLSAEGEADNWNFVSYNLNVSDTNLTSILENDTRGIQGNYDRVIYYEAAADEWRIHVPGRAERYNDLEKWDRTMGLWIRMKKNDTLTIAGEIPVNTDISLKPGWNMVGYPSEVIKLGGVPEEVTKVGHFDKTEENNLVYDSDPQNFEFRPFRGYWLYNAADTEVTWSVDYR